MSNRIMVGSRFGLWVVISKQNSDNHYRSRFLCRCECGVERTVLGQGLLNGSSKGCGHNFSASKTTHGERKNRTPEYAAWTAMKQRCLNAKCRAFKDWGGRGISICDRWMNYENFLEDVGRRPSSKHSLGRKDNNGNYTPNNVRWEVQLEQHNNKRSNLPISFGGQTKTLAQWARTIGISGTNLARRLQKWPIAKALTLPPNSHVMQIGRPKG